jgi:hypothetical protein
MTIVINPEPVVAAPSDITVCPGQEIDPIALFATPTDNGNVFTYSSSIPGIYQRYGNRRQSFHPNIHTHRTTPGDYTVTVSVATPDGCVSQNTTFNIVVSSDNGALSFSNCPVFNIMKANDPGECEADVTWEDPDLVNLGACTLESNVDVQITVVDAMGDPVSSCDVTTDPYSAGFSRTCTFPVGNYTVTYTTDVNGDGTFGETGDVSCSFDIMILDEEAPVITCPDNQVFDTDPDECNATWTIDGTEVTVSDNCASPPSTQWTINFRMAPPIVALACPVARISRQVLVK